MLAWSCQSLLFRQWSGLESTNNEEMYMQINITGHHVEVTSALKDYVHAKVEKLERHYGSITNVQVTLKVEKVRQMADATLHITGGEVFANAENEDMYAAIDQLSDKLDRQLIKHKEKNINRKQGSSH